MRTATQNQALRDRSRAALLDAGLRLFARDGYAATSVRKIAAEAGVATGLLYAHFPSKDALLVALFAQSMADVFGTFAEADAAPPRERVATLLRASVRAVQARREFWALGYVARTQPAVVAALGERLGEWTATIFARLAAYLADGGSPAPHAEAPALFAQIDGLCQLVTNAPPGLPVDDLVARVVARWGTPAPTS